jgi:hypothetical protein
MLTVSNAAIAGIATIAGIVGFIHALLTRSWDFGAVFTIVLAAQVFLLWRVWSRRPPVTIRKDLAGWLRDRAEVAGEPVETLADRSISAYRRALSGSEE